MQLTPRYDGAPVLRITEVLDDPAEVVIGQRARFASTLAGLDDEQWAVPSRCEGWSVRDVISHLATTNQFWSYSVRSGLGGAPTTMLAAFDPVATPAQLVDAVAAWSPAETLEAFVASNDELAEVLGALDGDDWDALAEAPPGHISIRGLALHALWDAWIHERDVLVPLGITMEEDPDEVLGSLAYVAGLGPAFLATSGSTRTGVLELRTTDPDTCLVVELGPSVVVRPGPARAGAVTVTADAIDLLEGLSFRAPLPVELAPDDRWLLGSLGAVFEQAG